MHQKEEDYNRDNGYKSRKFIISSMSILLITLLSVVFALYGWEIGIFSTVATSVVTIALGYSGISASRSVIPRFAQNRRGATQVTRRRPKPPEAGYDSKHEAEPEEGDV